MGKSWKDKSRRDKWERFERNTRKSKKNDKLNGKPNKWSNYDESPESY